MRDWSSEGAAERSQSYDWIVDKARQYLPDPGSLGTPTRVLVPGCGLARLPCDLAAAGFYATGNEFSFYMLVAASFMLNETAEADELPLHPWCGALPQHVFNFSADFLFGPYSCSNTPVQALWRPLCAGTT